MFLQPTCKFCGREIEWAEISSGDRVRKMPLDLWAPTYEVKPNGEWGVSNAKVSHFVLCRGTEKVDPPDPESKPIERRLPYKDD